MRAGVDQGGREDRQRAALFDVSGGAEESLGLLQRVGVHAAGQDLAGVRDFGVVGAGQAGDRVEQNDDVLAELDVALGLFDHHFGDLNVAAGGLVERAADHLGLGVALHVRDFFRTLVDQQNDQHHVGVVLADGVGDLLKQNRLAGSRRGDDQHALAHADRRHQIHDPHVQFLGIHLKDQPAVRMQRREVFEVAGVGDPLGVLAVDRLDAKQREVALALLGRTNLALHHVPVAQAEAADLRGLM